MAVSRTGALLRAMRPKQWTKNLIVFAPAAFGGVLFGEGVVLSLLVAFGAMCVASSSVYVLNDIRDREADRAYEKTRDRPFAAGEISVRDGYVMAAGLCALSLALAFRLDRQFAVVLVAYILLQVAYTFALKHVVALDVMAIAGGFVLRAVAGARAAGTPDSAWLLTCTVFLVSVIALGERRLEIRDLGEDAWRHRSVLRTYDLATLDVVMSAMLGSALVSYVIYTLLSPAAAGRPMMVLTAPFVAYGLFRYVLLLRREGGAAKSAEDLLLTDVPILIDVLLWILSVIVIVYVL